MVCRVRPTSNDGGPRLAWICHHPFYANELHPATVTLQVVHKFASSYFALKVGYLINRVRTHDCEPSVHGCRVVKPNRKAGGNWQFTPGGKDPLADLATCHPRNLDSAFLQWSPD